MNARLAWLSMLLALVGPNVGQPPGVRPVVIGYLFPQDQLLEPAQIAAEKLTHVNYAFANLRDGQVVEGFARDAENFKRLTGRCASSSHPACPPPSWSWACRSTDEVA